MKDKIIQYTQHQIHRLLCDRNISKEYKQSIRLKKDIRYQALHCPYYIPLSGVLGFDWGVIVNPSSKYFGKLMFEHDWCGCTNHEDVYGTQRGKDWILKVSK